VLYKPKSVPKMPLIIPATKRLSCVWMWKSIGGWWWPAWSQADLAGITRQYPGLSGFYGIILQMFHHFDLLQVSLIIAGPDVTGVFDLVMLIAVPLECPIHVGFLEVPDLLYVEISPLLEAWHIHW